MQRFARPQKKTRRGRNRPSQVGLVLAVGAVLGFAAFGIDDYVTAKKAAAKAAAAALAASDEEIYTGSILYMPDRGELCRQLLFDNQNGQFADNGYVDCTRAAYRSTNEEAKHWSAARVRVISTGFRDHY
ncbi:MAG: hypothetical protein WAL80_15810 [Xanthobacteraceae bacterium]